MSESRAKGLVRQRPALVTRRVLSDGCRVYVCAGAAWWEYQRRAQLAGRLRHGAQRMKQGMDGVVRALELAAGRAALGRRWGGGARRLGWRGSAGGVEEGGDSLVAAAASLRTGGRVRANGKRRVAIGGPGRAIRALEDGGRTAERPERQKRTRAWTGEGVGEGEDDVE